MGNRNDTGSNRFPSCLNSSGHNEYIIKHQKMSRYWYEWMDLSALQNRKSLLRDRFNRMAGIMLS